MKDVNIKQKGNNPTKNKKTKAQPTAPFYMQKGRGKSKSTR